MKTNICVSIRGFLVWLALAAGSLHAGEVAATPPAPPLSLTARSGGDAEVILTWEKSPDATGYTVFRSQTQNDTDIRQIEANVTATTYTASRLHNDTTYYFRIKAANAAGLSGFSSEVSATTKITGPPLPDGVYTLSPRSAPHLRLQLDHGRAVVAAKSLEAEMQRWRLTNRGLATYEISLGESASATGEATDAEPLLRQAWTLTPVSGGFRLTQADEPNLALHATDSYPGAEVAARARDESSAQTWILLTPPEGGADGMPDPGRAYVPSGYDLVFNDEFEGEALDTGKWEALAPYSQPHLNDEIECYSPEGVSMRDGKCVLRAEKATTTCGDKYPWRSGAITSRTTFTHGYFEARIKVPQGQGMWPAFWVTSSTRWPPEWDFLEIPNMVGTLYQYMHPTKAAKLTWKRGPLGPASIFTAAKGMPNPYDGFVIYGAEITPRGVTLWINGRLTAEWAVSADTIDPLWVSCNLAVGGKWAGAPDATTPATSDMLIDYVRIYQSPAIAAEVQETLAKAPKATSETP